MAITQKPNPREGLYFRQRIDEALKEIKNVHTMVETDAAVLEDQLIQVILTDKGKAQSLAAAMCMTAWIQRALRKMEESLKIIMHQALQDVKISTVDECASVREAVHFLRSNHSNEVMRTSLTHFPILASVVWHPKQPQHKRQIRTSNKYPWISEEYNWLTYRYQLHSQLHDSYRNWGTEEFNSVNDEITTSDIYAVMANYISSSDSDSE